MDKPAPIKNKYVNKSHLNLNTIKLDLKILDTVNKADSFSWEALYKHFMAAVKGDRAGEPVQQADIAYQTLSLNYVDVEQDHIKAVSQFLSIFKVIINQNKSSL